MPDLRVTFAKIFHVLRVEAAGAVAPAGDLVHIARNRAQQLYQLHHAAHRPVVIIQNNKGNKHSPTVIVAAISSKAGVKPKLPTHYFINAECGLKLPSIVLMEQIRTLDKRRLEKYIGRLSSKHIQGLNHALAVSVGLSKPIPGKLTLCLCGACADAFRGTGAFALRKITPEQAEKEMCAYCKQGAGERYAVRPKAGKGSI